MGPLVPSGRSFSWQTPLVVLVAGCMISLVGMGSKSGFGLFLEPMTVARGWSRESFALAIAIQNLVWGATMPFAGAIADRFGPVRVLVVGSLITTAGLWGMAASESTAMLYLTGGILTGLGGAFVAFSLAVAAMLRVVGPEKRSIVLGLGMASGSLGMVAFSPITQALIANLGWHDALVIIAISTIIIIPLALLLPNNPNVHEGQRRDQTVIGAIQEATRHRSFVLLTSGFFVCGFHVTFINVHFPAYITDLGLDPSVGAWSLALIGFLNIAGSFMSGFAGQQWSKKAGLSFIYLMRAVSIIALLILPKTAETMYIFASAMGLLWLSTVPLTNGIVVQVFGVRYFATLSGIVFFSHQIGSFLGAWLGGFVYDRTGSYDAMWFAGIALGIAAALIHLPINEDPLPRLRPAVSVPTAAIPNDPNVRNRS